MQFDEVAALIRSERTETIDLDDDHCLVIDDGGQAMDHATRFRITGGSLRPVFGKALVLGFERGSWASVVMTPQAMESRLVWEIWDEETQSYGVSAIRRKARSLFAVE